MPRSMNHITVAVEVLGGAGNDHVGPVLQRAEIDGAGEGGVHQERQAMLADKPRHRIEIHHADRGVDRRLDKDGPRVFTEGRPPVPDLRGIHVGHLDTKPSQLFIEQGPGAAVYPGTGNEVVAGAQYRQMGQRGGPHSTGHENRRLGALEKGVLCGDGQLIGIVPVTGITDFLVGTDRVGERGALVYGRTYRVPVGGTVRQSVNGDSRLANAGVGGHQSGSG